MVKFDLYHYFRMENLLIHAINRQHYNQKAFWTFYNPKERNSLDEVLFAIEGTLGVTASIRHDYEEWFRIKIGL